MIPLLKHLINENFQLAMKLYGSQLTADDLHFLTRLCNNDYTFKTLAGLLIEDKQSYFHWKDKNWIDALLQLRNYNKHLFPIEYFSFDSPTPTVTKQILQDRAEIIKTISAWPSIAKRNLRGDISIPRREFHKLKTAIEYIDVHLNFLENRTEEQKDKIFMKIFSSNHPTFEKVLDFVEEKKNLLQGGTAFSKKAFNKLVKKNTFDLQIVYDKRNIVVVDVTSQSGIKLMDWEGDNSIAIVIMDMFMLLLILTKNKQVRDSFIF